MKKQLDIQTQLASQIIVPPKKEGYFPQKGDLLFTFDIQYKNKMGYVAIDVLAWKEAHLGIFLKSYPVTVPYIPGLFAFREGPLLLNALNDLISQYDFQPQLLIVDGHGTAHPRKMGIASWLGLKAKVPSMGLAKETLLKYKGNLDTALGSTLAILLDATIVGHALRTQDNIKPVFVSSGHLVSQQNAIEIVMELRGKYRHIEPIRRADQAARRFAKAELMPSSGTFKKLIPLTALGLQK